MKETLYEESFNPTSLGLQKTVFVIYTVLLWIIGILDGIILFFFTTDWLSLIFLTGSFVGLWLLRQKIYYCVDLVFVSGQTRVIKVVHYKRRRKMLIFDYKDVLQVGRLGSEAYNKICLEPKIKKLYATPNKYISDGFYVYLTQDGVNYLVCMECKEEYLVNLVNFAGRKIIEKDYK